MIVDTSAIMAILLKEEDAEIFLGALQNAATRRMSGVSFVELTIAADRRDNPVPVGLVEEFVRDARISVEPIDNGQIVSARMAHLKFGRRRHPAGLNLGDCFVYALAKETGEPLLFKGNDFSQTDIASAL
jgi:ribonuclease VapC